MKQFREWLEIREGRMVTPNGFKKLDDVRWKAPPMHVSPGARVLYEIFKQEGAKWFLIAGGAVRDLVYGAEAKDFDFATNLDKDTVTEILKKYAKQHGIKTTGAVGEAFGVVRTKFSTEFEFPEYKTADADTKKALDKKNKGYEIATFRKDLEAGRDTKVEFISSPEEDAKRRDLTMNALFYDLGESIIYDFVGGMEDILEGRVRPVGNAIDRFGEDPLRVMRLLRFHARYYDTPEGIEDDVQEAIKQFVENGLTDKLGKPLAAERIREEFAGALQKAKSPITYLELLDRFGILKKYILPGFRRYSKTFINSRDPYLVIASILRFNPVNDEFVQTLRRAVVENSAVERILYYLRMSFLRKSDPRLQSKLQREPDFIANLSANAPDISDEELQQYATHFQVPFELAKRFKDYEYQKRLSLIPGGNELIQALNAREQELKKRGEKPPKDFREPLGRLTRDYNTRQALQAIGKGFREWLSLVE